MTHTEALKLALDLATMHHTDNGYAELRAKVRSATKEALAQPEHEPVGEAYLCDRCQTPFDGAYECPSCGHNQATKEPIYTTPPQRKPLTDEECDDLWAAQLFDIDDKFSARAFIRDVEAAHGIKENT